MATSENCAEPTRREEDPCLLCVVRESEERPAWMPCLIGTDLKSLRTAVYFTSPLAQLVSEPVAKRL